SSVSRVGIRPFRLSALPPSRLQPHGRPRLRGPRPPIIALEPILRPLTALQLLDLALRRLQLVAVDPVTSYQPRARVLRTLYQPDGPAPRQPRPHQQRPHRPAHEGHVSPPSPALPRRGR